jgi:hypothetical protein
MSLTGARQLAYSQTDYRQLSAGALIKAGSMRETSLS